MKIKTKINNWLKTRILMLLDKLFNIKIWWWYCSNCGGRFKEKKLFIHQKNFKYSIYDFKCSCGNNGYDLILFTKNKNFIEKLEKFIEGAK